MAGPKPIAAVPPGEYVHPKKGDGYCVLSPGPRGAAINCTNGQDEGKRMVVYRSKVDDQLYVREEWEFAEPGRFIRLE